MALITVGSKRLRMSKGIWFFMTGVCSTGFKRVGLSLVKVSNVKKLNLSQTSAAVCYVGSSMCQSPCSLWDTLCPACQALILDEIQDCSIRNCDSTSFKLSHKVEALAHQEFKPGRWQRHRLITKALLDIAAGRMWVGATPSLVCLNRLWRIYYICIPS